MSKRYYTYIRAGVADIAGRIILNSASEDIAEQSMTRIMLERNSWSQGILEVLKKSYEDYEISDISNSLKAMLNFV